MCRVYMNLRVRCLLFETCFLSYRPRAGLSSSYRRVRNARLVAPHDGCSPRAPARRTAGRGAAGVRSRGSGILDPAFPGLLFRTGVVACPRRPRGAFLTRASRGRSRPADPWRRGGSARAAARRGRPHASGTRLIRELLVSTVIPTDETLASRLELRRFPTNKPSLLSHAPCSGLHRDVS